MKRCVVAMICISCGAGDAVSGPDFIEEGDVRGAATDESGADVEASAAATWTPDMSSMDWPLRALTRSCAEVTLPAQNEVRMHCGDEGSIAAIEAPVDFHLAARVGATTFDTGDDTGTHDVRRPSVRVSATENLIVVEQVTCGACRRVMGRAWALDPARARDAVLAEAQRAAALHEAPLLRTVDAWRSALAQARASR